MAKEIVDVKDDYGFYSKLLKKPFDSLDELHEAENAYNEANKEKLRLAEERKQRAKEVEDAYSHVLDVRKKAKDMIDEAMTSYEDLLDKFVKDYGSYHMTYSNNKPSLINDVTWSDLIDSFFRFW